MASLRDPLQIPTATRMNIYWGVSIKTPVMASFNMYARMSVRRLKKVRSRSLSGRMAASRASRCRTMKTYVSSAIKGESPCLSLWNLSCSMASLKRDFVTLWMCVARIFPPRWP